MDAGAPDPSRPRGLADRADVLVVPDARQGPGAMPASAVAALDPAVNRLIARLLPGARHATGVGLGTELAQLRPYATGDDVRHLDPAASARTGTMHVRLHVPERAMTTWIVLDLSASMAFGTARRLKADVAEGVALVFARLGVRRAGNIGVVACAPGLGDAGLAVIPPHGSRRAVIALSALLGSGVAADATDAGSRSGGLEAALTRTGRIATQPGLVVVISDFRDATGWERRLGALTLRHAVLAVEVHDPRESELPKVGALALVDPETGRLLRVNTANPRLRERFSSIEAQRRAHVRRELRRVGAHHVALGTDEDWLTRLGAQLR